MSCAKKVITGSIRGLTIAARSQRNPGVSMDAAVFHLVEQIRTKHGTGDFGKVAQKLLAIVFCRLGYSHIEERGVQGVDIDAGKDGSKYAVEVKTTGSDA